MAGAIQTASGKLPQDLTGMQLQTPSAFQCEDATGTTIKSPLTVADTEIDLIVPANATTFVVHATGADLRIAISNSGTASAPYYVLKDGNTEAFPCGKGAGSGTASIFLLRDAAVSLTVHFRFELLS